MMYKDIEINEKKLKKTTTTIPVDVRLYIAQKGYKINELIRLGILAKEDNPQLIDRINQLENQFMAGIVTGKHIT